MNNICFCSLATLKATFNLAHIAILIITNNVLLSSLEIKTRMCLVLSTLQLSPKEPVRTAQIRDALVTRLQVQVKSQVSYGCNRVFFITDTYPTRILTRWDIPKTYTFNY